MFDVDTFLTALYAMVDDFCHSQPPKWRSGPRASLSDSEMITGFGFASASTKDQTLAGTFFAMRARSDPTAAPVSIDSYVLVRV